MPRSKPRLVLDVLLPYLVTVPPLLLLAYAAAGRAGDHATLVWSATVFTIAVALVSAVYVANRLSRRLGRMVAFARAVAAGDFTRRLGVVRRDELGTLEEDLNEMAERLRGSFRGMQEDAEKVRGMLRAMVEGVVVISQTGETILINRRAEELFDLESGVDYRGRRLIEMCRDPELQDLLRATLDSPPAAVPQREIMLVGAERKFLAVERLAAPRRRRASVRLRPGVPRHHRIEEARDDAAGFRRQRQPRAANAAHCDPRLRRDTALGSARRSRARPQVPVGHRPAFGASEPPDRRPLDPLGPRARQDGAEEGGSAAPALVDEVLEVLRREAQRGDVVLAKEMPADLPADPGDADRLQQVLINLADNAVKYTPAGGRVTVRARAIGTARRRRSRSPSPIPGSAFHADDLPRLTERFYRVDKARSRELGGTGLGLAIVKHIVQAHGGRLEIASELEAGTTVRFVVPAWSAAES